MSPEAFREMVKGKSDEELLPNFLRLMIGELDVMQAFMSGKLKVSGDIMFSQNIASLFKQPGT